MALGKALAHTTIATLNCPSWKSDIACSSSIGPRLLSSHLKTFIYLQLSRYSSCTCKLTLCALVMLILILIIARSVGIICWFARIWSHPLHPGFKCIPAQTNNEDILRYVIALMIKLNNFLSGGVCVWGLHWIFLGLYWIHLSWAQSLRLSDNQVAELEVCTLSCKLSSLCTCLVFSPRCSLFVACPWPVPRHSRDDVWISLFSQSSAESVFRGVWHHALH